MTTCAWRSATSTSPGREWSFSAIWFASVAVGRNSAASWPRRAAARSCRSVDGRILAPLLVADVGGGDRRAHRPRSGGWPCPSGGRSPPHPIGAAPVLREARARERGGLRGAPPARMATSSSTVLVTSAPAARAASVRALEAATRLRSIASRDSQSVIETARRPSRSTRKYASTSPSRVADVVDRGLEDVDRLGGASLLQLVGRDAREHVDLLCGVADRGRA